MAYLSYFRFFIQPDWWSVNHLHAKLIYCTVLSDSCIDNTYKCNCDNNSVNVETSDEGFLTDKGFLPVTALQFGDKQSGSKERGWYTLGPLICWGRN